MKSDIMDIKLLHGDCLELMKYMPDKSIDMIMCDFCIGVLIGGEQYCLIIR